MVCIAPKALAADLADGTYQVQYTVLQADSDSASMANDYFDKPATVKVSGAQSEVQLQVNHSKWITAFNAGNGAAVVATNTAANTRVLHFTTGSITSPVTATIKVDIDDDGLNYHHQYTIRLKFDTSSAKLVQSATSAAANDQTASSTAAQTGTKTSEELTAATTNATTTKNPQTGDNQLVIPYVLLFGCSALGIVYLVRKRVGGVKK